MVSGTGGACDGGRVRGGEARLGGGVRVTGECRDDFGDEQVEVRRVSGER